MSRKKLTVATDGSCLSNPNGCMGWAWADELGRWMSNGSPVGTNQKAELLGILSVFLAFPNTSLHLQLDSQYVLNITQKWMWGWVKRGWKRPNKEPIKNLAYVQLLHQEMITRKKKGLETTFEWVKGHNDHPLNTVADEQAFAASNRVKKNERAYSDSMGGTVSEKQSMLLTRLHLK